MTQAELIDLHRASLKSAALVVVERLAGGGSENQREVMQRVSKAGEPKA